MASLEQGDMLVVYSDGLPDARPDLHLENPENIAALCHQCDDVNKLIESLLGVAHADGELIDDLTVIVVKC
ncbi:SpoIIE family protein phosphatase, partial [Escherichia coli]|uniref:SpoIIE family protein phosphatase n=1 Tax=Escherichia coli TaxID=562 RepID=UPI00200C0518